jgi:hypothetical protein
MPVEIWDDYIDFTLAEFRLLGYLIRHQIRFGRSIPSVTQDELLNGLWNARTSRVRARKDKGCGLARNSLKQALDLLQAKGWIELVDISENPNIPRWAVRVVLADDDSELGSSSEPQVSNFDTQRRQTLTPPSNTVEVVVEEELPPLCPPKGGKLRSAKEIIKEVARGVIRDSIFPYYIAIVRPEDKGLYTLTPRRLEQGMLRLLECKRKCEGNWEGAEGLMKVAIDTIAKSDFHMGKHPKTEGRKYNDWEHLFRSAEILEKWFVRSGEGNNAESQGLFN